MIELNRVQTLCVVGGHKNSSNKDKHSEENVNCNELDDIDLSPTDGCSCPEQIDVYVHGQHEVLNLNITLNF